MSTITKTVLIKNIEDKHPRVHKVETAAIINELLDAIKDNVAKGNKVSFARFGSFASSHREERTGRNPRTQAKIDIPAKFVPVFHAGTNFKKDVNTKLTAKQKAAEKAAKQGKQSSAK